jgi:hypothetical protein
VENLNITVKNRFQGECHSVTKFMFAPVVKGGHINFVNPALGEEDKRSVRETKIFKHS